MHPWFRKHAVWVVPLGGMALTTASYWIAQVNANGTSVIEIKTVIPEIRQHMATTDEKLEKIDERTQQMNSRLANIEGRLKR